MSFFGGLQQRMAKATPITGASLIPPWLSGQPQWTDWDARKAVDEGYKASDWLRIAIDTVARAAASVPWYVSSRQGGGEWKRVDGHPLEQLLEEPNEWTSRFELIEAMVQDLSLAGNACVLKTVGAGGDLRELWPIQPEWVRWIPSRQLWIEGYEITRDGGSTLPVGPDGLLHVKFRDPSNPFWGCSPLKSSGRVVDTDVQALDWNKIALQNRAVMDAAITFPSATLPGQIKEAEDSIREKYASPERARRFLVLGGDAKVQPLSRSPVEMDFIAGMDKARDRILAAYGVPAVLLGLGESVTYSNYQTAQRAFWANNIVHLLERLRLVFSRSLLHHYGESRTLWLRYDLSGVQALLPDMVESSRAFVTFTAGGVPANQAIDLLQLPLDKIPGGDVPNGLRAKAPAAQPEQIPAGDPASKAYRPTASKAQRDAVAEINAVADEMSPHLAAIYLKAVAEIRRKVDLGKLAKALESGDLAEVERLIDFEALATRLGEMKAVLRSAMNAAAAVAAKQLGVAAEELMAPSAVSEAWSAGTAAAWASGMASGSKRSTIGAAEALSQDGAARDAGWSWIAKTLVVFLGVDAVRGGKLLKFVLGRLAGGGDPGAATDEAEKLAAAMEAERGSGFGLNLAQSAANAGRKAMWDEAVNSGQFGGDAERKFLTQDDEAVCLTCGPMDGQSIPYHGKYYSTGDGRYYVGPGPEHIHPECRCGEVVSWVSYQE